MRGDLLQVLFFAILAGFLIYRLFSALGKREGFEREDRDPFEEEEVPFEPTPKLGDEYVDPRLREAVAQMKTFDSHFRLDDFLEGAKAAFRMIVEAYAKGDLKTLKALLNLELYRDFEEAIRDRESRHETLETKIISIDLPIPINATVHQKKAQIRVKITSEQQHIRRNEAGKVIEGDPKQTEQITDLWTFEKDLNSSDPNWTLIKIET